MKFSCSVRLALTIAAFSPGFKNFHALSVENPVVHFAGSPVMEAKIATGRILWCLRESSSNLLKITRSSAVQTAAAQFKESTAATQWPAWVPNAKAKLHFVTGVAKTWWIMYRALYVRGDE